MTEQYITFEKFSEKVEALKLAKVFSENNIDYLIEEHILDFDPLFSRNKLNDEFRIKIRKTNFEKASSLINDTPLDEKPFSEEYYLFNFTDQELTDVISKRDEWSKFDFNLAQSILKTRGKELKQEEITLLKKQRIEDLAKPEEYNKAWVYIGYFSSLFGGLAGILIGWHLLNYKKKLPDGNHVYGYPEKDRRHGSRIVIIGAIIFLIVIIGKIKSFSAN